MSAETMTVFERVQARFASMASNRGAFPETEITQYDVTIDGKVAKTLVFNMREFELSVGPHPDAGVTITVDDADMFQLLHFKVGHNELLEQGKITAVGDLSILTVLDERAKRHAQMAAAAMAARAAAAAEDAKKNAA